MKTFAWLVAILTGLTWTVSADDVTTPPAYDQFIVIPLRIHVLTSNSLELANCKMTDAEVAKVVPKINKIWHKAGIHFGLESILREPAQVDRFQALLTLNNGQVGNNNLYAYLLPTSSRAFDGLHIYLFAEVPFNCMYLMAADATLVKEKPTLKMVQGGTDDPLSRVMARGLGIALGLTNREDDAGLLSSATTGIGLSEDEVSRSHIIASTIPGARWVSDTAKEAEAASKKGNITETRRLWTWLAEIPGPEAAAARKRLAALPPEKP